MKDLLAMRGERREAIKLQCAHLDLIGARRIKKIEEALAKYENVDDALEEIKKLSLESSKEVDQPSSKENYVENRIRTKPEVKIVKGAQTLTRLLKENWDLVKEFSQDRFLLKRSFD